MAPAGLFSAAYPSLVLAGLGMMLVGISFKLALAPFHLWTPDVYQGAPAPVTGLIATISKGATFALILRFFSAIALVPSQLVWEVLAALAFASMLLGNLLAVVQDNVKRLLAFSSIAHLGYLLIGLLAGIPLSSTAVDFYLTSYILTTLSAIGIITVLSTPEHEITAFADYRALFWWRPWIAVILTLALFSFTGLPPTTGLVGKILIAAAGIQAQLWPLLFMLVLGSLISVYYYLRLAITMFRRDQSLETQKLILPSNYPVLQVTLILMGSAIVILGIFPYPLIHLIEKIL